MKTSFLSILFLLSLLAMALSCKKDRDLHPAEEWFTDPMNLPQPPKGCKIVKTTYKTLMLPNDQRPGVETITLEDGQKVKVGTVFTTTYSYDDPTGRLVEEYQRRLQGQYTLQRYSYTPTHLKRYKEYTSEGDKGELRGPFIEENEFALNAKGKVSIGIDYTVPLKYDEDGHLVLEGVEDNTSNQGVYNYVEGNLVLFQHESLRYTNIPAVMTFTYTYQLDRPNLPSIYNFQGKESRNLPLLERWAIKNSRDFEDGSLYQIKYQYFYNKQGFVKRRIKHGKALNPQWLIEQDPFGIAVTDYEYECP
ncbi:hypothetical protein [Larkinella punicea]|uniref:DUF4595 domain-containing protein n=1 Tax=Larkinella punicea TaxID=2315727 RepID=A0A368JIR1_9BACT|nr:hypothetical protein [Larkinella punicea]RCR66564.1 hypothetical protein DUE52_26190 [Larkinella punicea]